MVCRQIKFIPTLLGFNMLVVLYLAKYGDLVDNSPYFAIILCVSLIDIAT